MRFTFFFEDLNESAKERLWSHLRERFWPTIVDDAELLGANPDELVGEQIDDYLNRHNFGFVVEV